MARKFLYVIAVITLLIIGLMFALRLWSEDLTRLAFVPSVAFEEMPAMQRNAWERPEMWISRPGMQDDPVRYIPEGAPPSLDKPLAAAVFFIHPTSYIDRKAWNASIDDPTSRERAALFVKGMASPFSAAEQVWVPRYRQAAVGAFLTDDPQADKAIDLAYGDVLAAFDVFAGSVPDGMPIVLAGHSQGAFLLRRLLRDRIAGTPLASRVAAAYVIGWPVSVEHDLPLMGLPPCDAPDRAGCVMSWLTVADPAETGQLVKAYLRRRGLDGEAIAPPAPEGAKTDGLKPDSPFLCTNPLTGTRGGKADAKANLGSLVPDFDTETGTLAMAAVPARCEADHFLHIGAPPQLELGPYVLPGNNYHLYDVTLFWGNVRADFERRVAAWRKQH
jgi:hypothetical protein